jgi:hypothetical protein|tara:strand:+ start:2695 stop:3075 length:381 start_codon:yes stop_codon:yes gene_type:complete
MERSSTRRDTTTSPNLTSIIVVPIVPFFFSLTFNQATPDAWRACVDRYQCTSYPEVKFWCLQTLAHAFLVPNLLAELPETDVAVLHRTMMGFVGDAVANTRFVCACFPKSKDCVPIHQTETFFYLS